METCKLLCHIFTSLWVVSLLSGVYGRPFSLTDPCTVVVRKPYYVSEITKNVNPSCNNGTLYWSYPAGNVVLEFSYPTIKPFLVCLDIKPDVAGIRYYDVTEKFPALKREIPYPGADNLACIPDLNGRVAIQAEGPRFPKTYAGLAMYLTIFDWTPQASVVL